MGIVLIPNHMIWIKATMHAYPQSDHALPHWKCVLWCCAKCTRGNIPDQETDDHYSDTTPSISVQVYHIIERCKSHGRILLKTNLFCLICKQDPASEQSKKIYTRNNLVMMETTIYRFNTSLYIPEIQWLVFHITHVHILATNHSGDSRRIAFKRRKSFQNVLCWHDYAEGVVASFTHQIQS